MVSHDHHNHTSKNASDSINPVLSFGVAANNGNRSLNSNLAFNDLVEPYLVPGMEIKAPQHSNIPQHHQQSYILGVEPGSTIRLNKNVLQK